MEQLYPEIFGFITYQGSMTAPPCYETVTWVLIDQPLNITSVQVRTRSEGPSSSATILISGDYSRGHPLADPAPEIPTLGTRA